MPSCGLLEATVFGAAEIIAGAPVDAAWLAGSWPVALTRDMASRFPPYRPRYERGTVD